MNNTVENKQGIQLTIKDVYPHRGQYGINEKVKIHVKIYNGVANSKPMYLQYKVTHLHEVVFEAKELHVLNEGDNYLVVEYMPPAIRNRGYGVEIKLQNSCKTTAFDVLDHWKERPRYGFLSDFYQEDEKDEADLNQMTKYHLNVVQFYDWMYKHEDLIPQEDYFVDLLDRKLSKIAVEDKIAYCHKYNMAAIGYGCIYAASKPFYENHKSWGLYTNDGRAQNLGDWFYIMNIHQSSPWFNHIIHQFQLAVEVFDFDGIHLDTYGFPKTAYSKLQDNRRLEHLDEQFGPLINETQHKLEQIKPEIGLIFNAVSNWGIEAVAPSKQAACYIEVWDPQNTYRHLYQLIYRARELSKKQVILAAYMQCYDKKFDSDPQACLNSLLLTSSVIAASGGFHLVLGEHNRVLCDPYYVNHGILLEEHEDVVRRYYDFMVRYGDILYDRHAIDISMTYTGGINAEYLFENSSFSPEPVAGAIWTQIREMKNYKVIHFVNMIGIESDIWNEAKANEPHQVEHIQVKALIDEEVKGIYYASPDEACNSLSIPYTVEAQDRGRYICFEVPKIINWGMIYVEVMG